MKAAILKKLGTVPQYGDLPEPIPQDDRQVLVKVKAAELKQLDKLKASGKHYTSVVRDKWIVLPENIEPEIAAAIPNAVMGSDMALLYRARIKKGDTVLINGATGVTGKIAVQMAKYRGASKIIATGRNLQSLESLKELGADVIVSLNQDDTAFLKELDKIQHHTPIDIILDYLWGTAIERLFLFLSNTVVQRPVKIVSVGEMAGAEITFASGLLRSKPIEIVGSGIGSISAEETEEYMKNILPSVFKLAAEGKIKIETVGVNLEDIEDAWQRNYPSGTRVVIKMP
ncbi:MAG: zinc-binding alcohol dehydrogenase family protein [Bacteroidales bacterium]|nr:zinc-binding alcohol dehydrogenase family protein [Bacteroidales bacterium]